MKLHEKVNGSPKSDKKMKGNTQRPRYFSRGKKNCNNYQSRTKRRIKRYNSTCKANERFRNYNFNKNSNEDTLFPKNLKRIETSKKRKNMKQKKGIEYPGIVEVQKKATDPPHQLLDCAMKTQKKSPSKLNENKDSKDSMSAKFAKMLTENFQQKKKIDNLSSKNEKLVIRLIDQKELLELKFQQCKGLMKKVKIMKEESKEKDKELNKKDEIIKELKQKLTSQEKLLDEFLKKQTQKAQIRSRKCDVIVALGDNECSISKYLKDKITKNFQNQFNFFEFNEENIKKLQGKKKKLFYFILAEQRASCITNPEYLKSLTNIKEVEQVVLFSALYQKRLTPGFSIRNLNDIGKSIENYPITFPNTSIFIPFLVHGYDRSFSMYDCNKRGIEVIHKNVAPPKQKQNNNRPWYQFFLP